MTNWNRIQEIDRMNKRELELNISESASWHSTYSSSAYIFVGNLNYDLNEGDLITVFSQFGEIVDCNLIRDKQSGESKGYAFIAFENQKCTNLAVDNMNGTLLLQRTLNVDHCKRYRKPRHFKDKEQMKDNKHGDIEEDEETYNERRKKIWNYEQYLNINTNTNTFDDDNIDNKHNTKIDANEVEKVNAIYLMERTKKEEEHERDSKELKKQIEMRKLKRKLLRMKRKDDKRKDQWIETGNELRDSGGRLIDIEKELKRRKHREEMEKKEQFEREMEEIKLQKKRNKLDKQSKSQRLNAKLKKLNKKMKKKKQKNVDTPPFKKRKI